ncbi:MAG: right-handed parallel beta-helix repeat-containing protein [Armatimonadetes bacterium]|nr:right-handed parallel beta-helix repeat-containing protein [Armatimonadota bacterium]
MDRAVTAIGLGWGVVATGCLMTALPAWGEAPGKGSRAYLVATDFATPDSVTGGIQEAVDALPPEGGEVYVPAGTHVIGRTLIIKDGVTLSGAGPGSIIKKNAAFRVNLVEDARKGHDYVVVDDVSRLKPGMAFFAVDKKHRAGIYSMAKFFAIDRIEGSRVYLKRFYSQGAGGLVKQGDRVVLKRLQEGEGGLEDDLTVADEACLVNWFSMARPGDRVTICDLALNGNREEQLPELVRAYGGGIHHGIQRGGSHWRIERILVYGTALGINVGGYDKVVHNCEFFDNWFDGIHSGGGIRVAITGNRIYRNGNGIRFCKGYDFNANVIVSGNIIFGNYIGIDWLGGEDRNITISGNQIYRNCFGGIVSGTGLGQGKEGRTYGARNIVISDNAVYSNCQERDYRIRASGGRDLAPAGMVLVNLTNSVVTGNRVYDELGEYVLKIRERAEAGQKRVNASWGYGRSIAPAVLMSGDHILISDGSHQEFHQVVDPGTRRPMGDGAPHPLLILADPLAFTYEPEKTEIRIVGSQPWGIFIGGPEARGNVVANNVVSGNSVGGILWDGEDTVVQNNTGPVARLDLDRTLEENFFPAEGRADLPNTGFEAKGEWVLSESASLARPGRTGGKQALRLRVSRDGEVAEAVSARSVTLQPNTVYRLSAWVRSSALEESQPVLPSLSLCGREGEALSGGLDVQTRPVVPLRRHPLYQPKPAPGAGGEAWVRTAAEITTGPAPVDARISIRLEGARSEAWVDDIVLESRKPLAKAPAPDNDNQWKRWSQYW